LRRTKIRVNLEPVSSTLLLWWIAPQASLAWGFFCLADLAETRYPRGLSRLLLHRSAFSPAGEVDQRD